MLSNLAAHTLHGIYFGSILFMIASGLTIIFGVLGVLNLAHGELYALGAFLGVTILGFVFGTISGSVEGLTILVVIAALIIGVMASGLIMIPVGYIIESTLIRPIYHRAEYYQLVMTFGILLVLIDVMKLFWGTRPVSASGPYQMINDIPFPEMIGSSYPTYNMFVIIFSFLSFLGLLWFFNRSKPGRIIRATAINKELAASIGVDTKRTFTLVFALGAFFAGFGGALAAPPIQASLGMGTDPLILAFVIIVIGGIGSIHGSYIAAIIVGVFSRWATWLYPPVELAAPFIVMILILLLKPQGLFKSWGEFE